MSEKGSAKSRNRTARGLLILEANKTKSLCLAFNSPVWLLASIGEALSIN